MKVEIRRTSGVEPPIEGAKKEMVCFKTKEEVDLAEKFPPYKLDGEIHPSRLAKDYEERMRKYAKKVTKKGNVLTIYRETKYEAWVVDIKSLWEFVKKDGGEVIVSYIGEHLGRSKGCSYRIEIYDDYREY